MDLEKVLSQLRSELRNVDAAIASLERLKRGLHQRGRPPLWLDEGKVKPKSPKPPGSKGGKRPK